MELQTNISLRDFTTMRLGGTAKYMATVTTEEELQDICRHARQNNLPIFILGGGSNTIVHDKGFDGIVIRNSIKGFEVLNENEVTRIAIAAGEDWDSAVKKTVEMNLSGIEALSAIPGTVGGAPVQNIGAYGQEIADVLISVRAYNITADVFETLTADKLDLSYRHSIFRGIAAGRYVITSVTIELSQHPPSPPFYAAVQEYLNERQITVYTPQVIRDAVISIRKNKLPDPALLPNAGSFFKNAIVSAGVYSNLQSTYPDIPAYDTTNGQKKIPTGWLIEQTGLKGMVLHGFRIHEKNGLVLINESATSYDDLAAARDEIITAVYEKFGIKIEQEPLEL